MIKSYIDLFLKFINKNIIRIISFLLFVLYCTTYHIENCIFQFLFGLPCPGCGLGRACISLIKFDFIGAFFYNPFVFVLPIIMWVIIFQERPIIGKINKSSVFWVIIGVILFLIYILRMIFVYPNEPLTYYDNNLFNIIKKLFS